MQLPYIRPLARERLPITGAPLYREEVECLFPRLSNLIMTGRLKDPEPLPSVYDSSVWNRNMRADIARIDAEAYDEAVRQGKWQPMHALPYDEESRMRHFAKLWPETAAALSLPTPLHAESSDHESDEVLAEIIDLADLRKSRQARRAAPAPLTGTDSTGPIRWAMESAKLPETHWYQEKIRKLGGLAADGQP